MGAVPESLAPTTRLRKGPIGTVAELDWIGERTREITATELDILEAYFRHGGGDDAFRSLSELPYIPERIRSDAQLQAARAAIGSGDARVVLGMSMFAVVPTGEEPTTTSSAPPMDVRGAARRWRGLLRWLFDHDDRPLAPGPVQRTDFDHLSRELVGQGLVTSRPASAGLGSLLPRRPYCQLFGMQRGTPLDRYYLLRFIDDVRADTVPAGRVLDVGGEPANRVTYRLHGVERWDTMDENPQLGATILGDINDPGAVPGGSVDTVLLFNVLEHCRDPQLVVSNVLGWLRPGGVCLAMVPAAQRLHDFPKDYGRPSALRLEEWFSAYGTATPRVYGNLATAMGSLAGLAAEEFDEETLTECLPDYPVTTCLFARKATG